MNNIAQIIMLTVATGLGLVIVILLYTMARRLIQQEVHLKQLEQHAEKLNKTEHDGNLQHQARLHQWQTDWQNQVQQQTQQLNQQQATQTAHIQDSLYKGLKELRQATSDSLMRSSQQLEQRFTQLQQTTDTHLQRIGNQVESRLQQGFDKTQAIFSDVIKRLTIIDKAQQQISHLSSQVIDLQQLLNDKRSRGAFGEVQLNHLLSNTLPEQTYTLQATLSNQQRCDCLLHLPEPTGNMVIDAKFPLESYRTLSELSSKDSNYASVAKQFQQDIKYHIQSISKKYIIEGETASGAIMFIPAEAIFSEIHAKHPALIDYANQQRIWLSSPTTMMAILTTLQAVIKDDATKRQVHVIQQHLRYLHQDFALFQKRMEKLAKHINLANNDVNDIHISAGKIKTRFDKIENVQLEEDVSVE